MPIPWENEQWYLNALYDDHIMSTMTGTRVIVGTVSTVILAANASRKYALIVNDTGGTVYLNGGTAVMNQGPRLNGNGGNYEMLWMNLYQGQIQGINSAVAGTVTVTEGT